MVFEITVDQLPQVPRLAGLVPFGDRIAALIDFALEALGLFPRGGDRPIRPSTDSEAAFPRLDPISQDEGARAAAGDADAEADNLFVIDDGVLRLRLKPFHSAFGEVRLHAFDPFRSTQPRPFPISKMLSAGLPMNGGKGRKPGGKGLILRRRRRPEERFRVRTVSVAFPVSNGGSRLVPPPNAHSALIAPGRSTCGLRS